LKSLRNNIVANFLGQGWSGLMGVIFVPVYIALLGIESYGLIGLYVSLQALYYILDVGLSATLNRELARYARAGIDPDQRRDLVRTLEWLYWPIGLLIMCLTWVASTPIAVHWLHPVALSRIQVSHAIALMGLSLALQWPCSLYAGGFRGLERQVSLNVITAVFVTLRSAGVIPVLYFYAPTIEVFLWWQVVVGAAQTMTMAVRFWRLLPPGTRRPSFRRERLSNIAHFTAGMAGISALSFLLTYADRIILSAVLPLNQFGYYALAATTSAALAPFVQSFFNAIYPRFSNLAAGADKNTIASLYHSSTQLLTVIVASVAAVVALFSYELLLIWSRDPILAASSGPILSLLIVGVALNGLATLPYALQLAHGWTRLALRQNAIALVAMLPATWWLANHWGSRGVAAGWLVLNLGFVLITVPLMHRRLLIGELERWYLRDILPPAVAAIVIATIARLALPSIPKNVTGLAILGGIGGATLFAAALCTPASRAILRRKAPV
jgi:O-antigen/teichoic acid export membrane protein